jgi:autotransporter-associated beta strand protein
MTPRKFPQWLAGLFSSQLPVAGILPAALVFSVSFLAIPAVRANTANTFSDATADLLLPSNWSAGHVPNVAEDAIISPDAFPGEHTINGNLTVGSLDNLFTGGDFLIRNTNTAGNSVLTLGGAGNLGNSVSGTAADLLYVVAGGSLVIEGSPNSTNVLQVALGQTGNFNIAGNASISAAITGGFAINKTGSGTLNLSNLANSFSGGIAVKAGTLVLEPPDNSSTSTAGTGTITIGDSANTGASATLNLQHHSGVTYDNAIATAGTGINTLNLADWYATFNGTVTLGGNLVISTTNQNNSTIDFTNTVSGTGNITTQLAGPRTDSSIVFETSVNNVGSITNSGTGAGTTTFKGVIGSNVTTVTQDSATSPLALAGPGNTFTGGLQILSGTAVIKTSGAQGTNTITLGGVSGAATTLEFNAVGNGGAGEYTAPIGNPLSVIGGGDHTVTATAYNPNYSGAITLNSNNLNLVSNNNDNSVLTVSGGVSGTGNLNLQVNGTNGDSKVILTGTAINNTGTITNSGTGVGQAVIEANIGGNVSGVVQNSATSQMFLRGTNSFTGGIQIKAGTLNVEGKALGDSDATNVGAITLGDSANTGAAATLNVSDFGIGQGGGGAGNNPINVVGTGSRTLSVTSWSPVFSGAVTLNNTNLLVLTNNTGGSDITLNGGLTGVGNLTLQSNATTTNGSRVTIGGAGANNTGTITNSGTGVGTSLDTTISGPIGTNVTGLIQNSASSRLIISGANTTFVGNTTVTLGTLQLTDQGSLTFLIGANGVNNSIGGTGTADLNGTFNFNLVGAAASGSWNIVDVNNLTETYGSAFNVAGFTEVSQGLWTSDGGTGPYTFNESTGLLTAAIPEPSAVALLGLPGLALLGRRVRRKG